MPPRSPTTSRDHSTLVIAFLAAGVGLIAVTKQSLWIDEAHAAAKAMQPSLSSWWAELLKQKGSDLQMPGYMLGLWFWEKIGGHSEWWLRAANIPLFILGVGAGARVASGLRLRLCWVLLCLTNAFLWYYLSEARPYLALFAFGTITAASLWHLRESPEECLLSQSWLAIFTLGILGLCGSSLLSVPWALGALLAAFWRSGPRAAFRLLLNHRILAGLLMLGLGVLGIYYLWTLRQGARASELGQTSSANVAYVFYELVGLAGLGPGRLNLRAQGASEAFAFLPGLALGGTSVLVLAWSSFSALRRQCTRPDLALAALAVGFPMVLIFAAGFAAPMRLVGRHFTPLLPYLLGLLAVGLAHLVTRKDTWRWPVVAAALAVLLASSLEIRFAPRHRRDDYRNAAAYACEALGNGQQVWWLADESSGLYYGVPFGQEGANSAPDLTAGVLPDCAILSKPDIYDPSGQARALLTRHGFKVVETLPAFEFFAR